MSWAIWITGPPGSGKSTIARAVEGELQRRGQPVKRLELDEIRKSITPDPRYSDSERELVYRVLGYLAELLVDEGTPLLIDATAHRRRWRDRVRSAVPRFAEVQLVCPLEVCQQRERARPRGHAPPDIYAHAGQPGATVPGVDVPYEAAVAPELVIDTSARSVAESVMQILHLAARLERTPPVACPPAARREQPGWAIWITGPPGSGKSALARCVVRRLRARGGRVHVLELAAVRDKLLEHQPAGPQEQDLIHRAIAYAAKLLTETGESVIVDATASRRSWRNAARAVIPAFAEIQLRCATEVCLERERSARWGLAFHEPGPPVAAMVPDIVLDYEVSSHAEATVQTDRLSIDQAADCVMLAIAQLVARAPRA